MSATSPHLGRWYSLSPPSNTMASQALCLLTSHPAFFLLPLCKVQGLGASFPRETLVWHLEMAACLQRTLSEALGLLTADRRSAIVPCVPLTTLRLSHSKALWPRRIL